MFHSGLPTAGDAKGIHTPLQNHTALQDFFPICRFEKVVYVDIIGHKAAVYYRPVYECMLCITAGGSETFYII